MDYCVKDNVDKQLGVNEYMCYVEAEKNGHDTKSADNCDAGSLNCRNCPFENKALHNKLGLLE